MGSRVACVLPKKGLYILNKDTTSVHSYQGYTSANTIWLYQYHKSKLPLALCPRQEVGVISLLPFTPLLALAQYGSPIILTKSCFNFPKALCSLVETYPIIGVVLLHVSIDLVHFYWQLTVHILYTEAAKDYYMWLQA